MEWGFWVVGGSIRVMIFMRLMDDHPFLFEDLLSLMKIILRLLVQDLFSIQDNVLHKSNFILLANI